jgi:hypothetical protein
MDVPVPDTRATIDWLPDGLMWLRWIPTLVAPVTVKPESTNDFVNLVPSIETPTEGALLIANGPMTKGSAVVPVPLLMQPHEVKSESLAMVMGAWDPALPLPALAGASIRIAHIPIAAK